jgi:hypothetical protein
MQTSSRINGGYSLAEFSVSGSQICCVQDILLKLLDKHPDTTRSRVHANFRTLPREVANELPLKL